VDVVEWSRALDVRLIEWCAVYQWCGFKSRRGKNKKLTALKSNSNTGWFNFQTHIYIYTICMIVFDKKTLPTRAIKKCHPLKKANHYL
jgi:hypothetical protein